MQCMFKGNVSLSLGPANRVAGYIICYREMPSPWHYFVYGFVVPSLTMFGFCANLINAYVFTRPKMTPSAFSYLAALSILDCISCLIICLTAFSRSILHHSPFWLAYDLQFQMALLGTTTGSANLILACVSFDRFIYLKPRLMRGSPGFCRREVAFRMIVFVILVSICLNMPYFFVFSVNDDKTFQPTEFYYTRYFEIHNWLTFFIMAVFPAFILLVGNVAIILAFRKWTKHSRAMETSASNAAKKTTQKRYLHQMKLTITILIVISLYFIGELPAHLTSWKCALNLIYGGDLSKVDFDLMERLEIICMCLNSLQLSVNIIIYAIINPSFMPEFFKCLKSMSDKFFMLFSIKPMCSGFGPKNCTTMANDDVTCDSRCSKNEDVHQNSGQVEMRIKTSNAPMSSHDSHKTKITTIDVTPFYLCTQVM